MSEKLEAIGDAITAALDEHSAAEVLQIVTGAFVGLTVEMVRRQVGPEALEKPITIDGCGNRNITIHPAQKPEGGDRELG